MDPHKVIPSNLLPTFDEFRSLLPPLEGPTVAFSPKAWFLGPKAENIEIFSELVKKALDGHIQSRKDFHPTDSPIFEENFKSDPTYLAATEDMKKKTDLVVQFLKKSLPFSSLRYVGHMCSDVTIASVIGTIATILYNPNNVTIQASPVTTYIEMAVGNDLARMVGFEFPKTGAPKASLSAKEKRTLELNNIYPSFHLTSGGSIANNESAWASFWSAYIPLAIKTALDHEDILAPAKDIQVELANGKLKSLSLVTSWEGCNIKPDDCVGLPYRVAELCNIDPSEVTFILKKYHPSTIGIRKFFNEHNLNNPVMFAPGSAHYSVPKSAAILGLGSDALIHIPVDAHARMDLQSLRAHLESCISHKIPVISVTCVLGTTEETAVDPIAEVLKIRKELNLKGLSHSISVDAAWGGYYTSTCRDDYVLEDPFNDVVNPGQTKKAPSTYMDNMNSTPSKNFVSKYVQKQFAAIKECETITIDPHKAGYIPYPCGSVGYRNSRFRDCLVYSAVYIGGSGGSPSVGIYGMEGSKPGSAAVSTYLSHSVLRTSSSGYGQILKRTLLNTKLFYLRLLWLCDESDSFQVIGVPQKPSKTQLDYFKSKLIKQDGTMISSDEICKDKILVKALAQIGPDLNIICFGLNFKNADGSWNTDYNKYRTFNNQVYERFDYIKEKNMDELDLVFSNTSFSYMYGAAFINDIVKRIGITNAPLDSIDIPVLRSTVMDPFANETTTGSSYDDSLKLFRTETNKIAKAQLPPQQA